MSKKIRPPKDMPVLDARGRKIEVGDKVIYNLSGGLAHGKVLAALVLHGREYPYQGTSWEYRIDVELLKGSTSWIPEGHVSHVKNPKGIIVLTPELLN